MSYPPPPAGQYPPPPPGQYPPPPPPGQYVMPPGPPPPPGGYYFNPQPPQKSRGTPVAIVVAFVAALALVAVVAGVIVLASQPAPPVPQCLPDVPCALPPPSGRPISNASPTPLNGVPGTPRPTAPPFATFVPGTIAPASPGASPGASPAATPIVVQPSPISDSPAATSGTVVTNDALGYSFEFQSDDWTLGESSDPNRTVLNGVFFDAQIVIEAAPATTTVAQLLEQMATRADRFTLGRAPDNDSYDAVLGPGIGYIRGEGAVYSGTLIGQDGTPIEPVGLTLVASTNGRITVAVLVIAGQPDLRLGADTHQFAVRSSAGLILKTFDWDVSQ